MILAALMIFVAMSTPAKAQTAALPSGHEYHVTSDAAQLSPAADAVQPNLHDHAASGKHAQMMDAQMKKMRDLMEKIRATADPKERWKLMREHMAGMRAGMKMMNDGPGCQMMAGGMKGGAGQNGDEADGDGLDDDVSLDDGKEDGDDAAHAGGPDRNFSDETIAVFTKRRLRSLAS